MKKIVSITCMFALLLTCAIPSYALDIPEVTFNGNTELFEFDNVDTYIDAQGTVYPDLFTDFKGMIPGDSIEQSISVGTKYISDYDYVNIYLKVGDNNGDYDTLLDNEYVTLTVYDGDTVVSQGTLSQGVLLGTFDSDESMDLTVVLSIDILAGNEIADLVAIVQWVFVAEIIEPTIEDDPVVDDTPEVDDIPEVDEPVIDTEDPDTGDSNSYAIYIGLGAVAVIGIVLTRKKKNIE